MDKFLNTTLLFSPGNWLRIWLMLGAGFVIIYLMSRALPELVPTNGD
jgi:hypothetical protein